MVEFYPSRSRHLYAPDGLKGGSSNAQYDLFAAFASTNPQPAPPTTPALETVEPAVTEAVAPLASIPPEEIPEPAVTEAAVLAAIMVEEAPEPATPRAGEQPAAAAPATNPYQPTPRVRVPLPDYEWGPGENNSPWHRREMNTSAISKLNQLNAESRPPSEREIQSLARYTGFGGAGNSLNEYFTPEAIADAMWGLAHKAGFAGGLVLEPSCGIGVFLRSASENAQIVGVEMSQASAGIANILHAQAGHEIINSSFEQLATSDPRMFDLVIGNPPFGIRGATVRDHKRDIATAQEYFLDTALDKCRPGGLVALVLPTGVMDNVSMRQLRSDLLLKGEFVSAWRLPNAVFHAAGTDIPTDILLLRRREPEITLAARHLTADQREEIGMYDEDFVSGEYFDKAGAPNVLGAMHAGWRAARNMGNDIKVTGTLEAAVEALNAWEPPAYSPAVTLEAIFAAAGEAVQDRMRRDILAAERRQAAPGDIRVVGGVRYVLQQYTGETASWVSAPASVPEAIRAAVEIGQAIHHIAAGGRGGAGREEVMAWLDQFQAAHGAPGTNSDIQEWMRSPYWEYEPGLSREEVKDRVLEARRMLGLTIGAVLPDGRGYSDLLTGAVKDAPQLDIQSAIAVASAATERFTAEAVARLVASTPDEIAAFLMDSQDYAVLPDGATWESRDKYFSGELWPKYDAALAGSADANLQDWLRQRLGAQANLLLEKIAPVGLEQVEIQMNSGFIKPEDITAWLADRPRSFVGSDHHRPQPAEVTFEGAVYTLTPMYDTNWLSNDNKLIANYLNREGVKKTEIGEIEALNAEFRLWVLGGPHRDAIETRYNRAYRGFAKREYSAEPINIPGLNPERSLNGYHYAALRWGVEMGGGIAAYDVGLGKTTFALLLSRLAVAMGRAERPAFVVPLSVISNWEAEAKSWFPNSTSMVIGETRITKRDGTISAKSDSAAVIRTKLLQAQQNNVDFIFITEPAWNRLDLNPEKKAELVDRDFWVQRGQTLGHAGTKRENKVKERFKQSAAARDFDSREDTLYFEDLKFDMLIVDEMHRYKNLYSPRNRWGGAPKYLGGSGQSNRAYDTYLKSAELRERTGGLNVYGLTASPTKNSPLEIYSILSHIAPSAFDRLGITNSEEFLDRFCTFEVQPILTLQGEVEEATVVSGFKNLDELLPIMERFIYRKTAEDVGLKMPRAEPVVHIVNMTPAQQEVYEKIRSEMASKTDEASDIHIFRALDLMGKASIDLSLIDPELYKDEPSPLIEACVDAATLDFQATGSGQIIFCDHIQVHERIKAELVKRGVEPERVVIMNATTVPRSEDRYRESENFNAGNYHFVIGNQPVIGEAVNLQHNAGGSHVLGVPWEPEALKQMRGRARRQGNQREVVHEHIYFDKGGCSAYRFQILEGKNDWNQVLWSGEKQAENPARTGGFSRMELLIMLAPDPVAARKKYEADIQAAEERHSMAARRRAGDDFRRLQEMQASLQSIGEEGRSSETGQRLIRSEEVLRDKLLHNPNFGPKGALENSSACLFFPSQDIVLRVGDLVIRSTKETGFGTPFVEAIAEIDWKKQNLYLAATNRLETLGTPISYADIEEKLNSGDLTLAPEGTPSREEILARALGEATDGFKSIRLSTLSALRGFSDNWLIENHANISRHAIHAAKNYVLNDKIFPYITDAGEVGITNKFGLSNAAESRGIKLLVPTQENLQRLREYAVSVDRCFKLTVETKSGARGTTYHTLAVSYGNFPRDMREGAAHPNPALSAVHLLYGKEEFQMAREAALADALESIKSASNAADALVNGARLLDISSYSRHLVWSERAVELLGEKFADLGVLDQTLQDAIPFTSNTQREGLSKAYLYDKNSQMTTSMTLRAFLAACAPNAQIKAKVNSIVFQGRVPEVQEGEDLEIGL